MISLQNLEHRIETSFCWLAPSVYEKKKDKVALQYTQSMADVKRSEEKKYFFVRDRPTILDCRCTRSCRERRGTSIESQVDVVVSRDNEVDTIENFFSRSLCLCTHLWCEQKLWYRKKFKLQC